MAGRETREARVGREDREAFETRIARAFGHPYRVRIMEILNERDAAPTDVSKISGIHTSNLNYHFGVLEECDCIELVKQVPVRGTVKHVYRSKQPTMLADLAWAALSSDVRSEISRTMLNNTMRRLGDALAAATFDHRKDRHLSLQTISVDWQAWEELVVLMNKTMEQVAEIEKRALKRSESDDRFPATVTLLNYESPRMYEVR
jgi:hypothetical protein